MSKKSSRLHRGAPDRKHRHRQSIEPSLCVKLSFSAYLSFGDGHDRGRVHPKPAIERSRAGAVAAAEQDNRCGDALRVRYAGELFQGVCEVSRRSALKGAAGKNQIVFAAVNKYYNSRRI